MSASARSIVSSLRRRGVRLLAIDGRLRVDAPHGALSDDEVTQLRTQKADILAVLEEMPWWDDPTEHPLPVDADDADRGIRGSFAPILHLPPHDCIAPVVCRRLGSCGRADCTQPASS